MKFKSALFRTDASRTIGIGHVMRCITLAAALQEKGVACVFACRPFDGNLIRLIEESGFVTVCMTSPRNKDVDSGNYESWLGVSYESDAEETNSILASIKPEWVIVDHYGIDERWENIVKQACKHIFVIDDLANRRHACFAILDSSFGRDTQDYVGLVDTNTPVYAGPTFCILRPEFPLMRRKMESRNYGQPLKNILITFGGADVGSVTIQTLEDLERVDVCNDLSIVVILGPISTHYEIIRKMASNSRHTVTIEQSVSNMGEYFIWADLCIGAVGSSTWERCCLGCPSIVTILAENQRDGARKLEEAGLLLTYSSKKAGELAERIRCMDANMRERLSINGLNLVDGLGVHRVLTKLSDIS